MTERHRCTFGLGDASPLLHVGPKRYWSAEERLEHRPLFAARAATGRPDPKEFLQPVTDQGEAALRPVFPRFPLAHKSGFSGSRAEPAAMVTAVIPAHGRVELLQRAIDSVLAQRDCEVELIVVDDGSGLELEGPYRVLRQPRQGPGPARNLGARHGRGEWLALLDSDDVWEPDKCRSQLDYLVAGGFRAGRLWISRYQRRYFILNT